MSEQVPDQTADDRDEGWGDRPAVLDTPDDPEDLRRFLDERPPHHGD